MDLDKPVFRLADNFYVQPGDFVWTDRIHCYQSGPDSSPVVIKEPVSGKVREDGKVLLADGETLVELANCRPCEKVIRI